MDIAQDQVSYSEYPTMGEINDERELIEELEHDPQARSQYPVLNQFYLDRQGSILDKLNEIDRLLKMATDTLINTSTLHTNLVQARTLNTALNGSEYFAQNEKWINDMYFKAILDGEAYSLQEMEDIDALASQCPYIGGMAVYKARALNTMLQPTKSYNDIGLCNAVGVYKNGKGVFDDEEGYLDSLLKVKPFTENLIKVYPNPTYDLLNIEFAQANKEECIIELMDMYGKTLERTTLESGSTKEVISLAAFASGIYACKVYSKGRYYLFKVIKQ